MYYIGINSPVTVADERVYGPLGHGSRRPCNNKQQPFIINHLDATDESDEETEEQQE